MRRSNGPPRRLEGSTTEVLQLRWGVLTPAKGVCALGRTAWCTLQGEYFVIILIFIIFFNNFLLHSRSLTCAGYIALKQRCVSHTPTNTPAIIPTYGGVLSAIEKALRELMKEYRGVGKSLWDLVEGQKRNMAQLERIGAVMEQRWGSEEESGKESGDEEEGSKDGPGENQEGGTPSSASC